MRIAIGGIMHESNTFNRSLTTLADFANCHLERRDEIIAAWRGTNHEMGGFVDGAAQFGYDLCPLLMASATPSGPLSGETFEDLSNELLDRLATADRVDGLLLALHGAMVSEHCLDADGEIVHRIRQLKGPDFPIVVTHDFHANISDRIVEDSTALIVYKTNPHVDQRERGLQGAGLIVRIVRGEVVPVQAHTKIPMLLNIRFHNTNEHPLHGVMNAVRHAEETWSRVLAASFAGAYPYADVPQMGPTTVVVTDGDRSLAEELAKQLAALLWERCDELVVDIPDAPTAVQMAMRENSPPPVVLVDMGDNIGGGSAGDGTILLQELIRQEATGWLVVLCDPEAVAECEKAGVDASVELSVGGKRDLLHGSPVKVQGRVRSLHDGRFEERAVRHGGLRFHDQGKTAVLVVRSLSVSEEDNYLILTSNRQPPFSLQQILSLGIDPTQRKIIVVKAAIAFRAAYEQICGKIIEVDTPGLTSVNPRLLEWHHVRRPLWGLDYMGGDSNK